MTRKPVVLITGATGFIGGHLAELLHKNGLSGQKCELRLLARETSTYEGLAHVRGEIIKGDLLDPQSLVQAVRDVDYIFHIAGQSAMQFTSPDCLVKGTSNLADLVIHQAPNHTRFIFLSSQAATGPNHKIQLETESDLPRPINLYGTSKLEAEAALQSFGHALRTTIIRPPFVYGPHDRGLLPLFKMINDGLMLIPGRKDDYFSVVFVKNLVAGMIKTATHDQAENKTFCITDEELPTKEQLFQLIAGFLQVRPHRFIVRRSIGLPIIGLLRQLDPVRIEALYPWFEHWFCTNARAKEVLDFQTPYTQKEGLKQTIDWYLKQGWLK